MGFFYMMLPLVETTIKCQTTRLFSKSGIGLETREVVST
jgi:hypothetical protein